MSPFQLPEKLSRLPQLHCHRTTRNVVHDIALDFTSGLYSTTF